MGTESLIESKIPPNNNENRDENIDYDTFESSALLSQWLNSLESRSSLFWLNYIDDDGDEDEDDIKEKRANSLESTEATTSEDTDDSLSDEPNSLDMFLMTPCRSIAHRDSDLLVALTENCTLGPVCYFCR